MFACAHICLCLRIPRPRLTCLSPRTPLSTPPPATGYCCLGGLIPMAGFDFLVTFQGKLKCPGLRALSLAS